MTAALEAEDPRTASGDVAAPIVTVSSAAGRRANASSRVAYAAAKAEADWITGVILDVAGGAVLA